MPVTTRVGMEHQVGGKELVTRNCKQALTGLWGDGLMAALHSPLFPQAPVVAGEREGIGSHAWYR